MVSTTRFQRAESPREKSLRLEQEAAQRAPVTSSRQAPITFEGTVEKEIRSQQQRAEQARSEGREVQAERFVGFESAGQRLGAGGEVVQTFAGEELAQREREFGSQVRGIEAGGRQFRISDTTEFRAPIRDDLTREEKISQQEDLRRSAERGRDLGLTPEQEEFLRVPEPRFTAQERAARLRGVVPEMRGGIGGISTTRARVEPTKTIAQLSEIDFAGNLEALQSGAPRRNPKEDPKDFRIRQLQFNVDVVSEAFNKTKSDFETKNLQESLRKDKEKLAKVGRLMQKTRAQLAEEAKNNPEINKALETAKSSFRSSRLSLAKENIENRVLGITGSEVARKIARKAIEDEENRKAEEEIIAKNNQLDESANALRESFVEENLKVENNVLAELEAFKGLTGKEKRELEEKKEIESLISDLRGRINPITGELYTALEAKAQSRKVLAQKTGVKKKDDDFKVAFTEFNDLIASGQIDTADLGSVFETARGIVGNNNLEANKLLTAAFSKNVANEAQNKSLLDQGFTPEEIGEQSTEQGLKEQMDNIRKGEADSFGIRTTLKRLKSDFGDDFATQFAGEVLAKNQSEDINKQVIAFLSDITPEEKEKKIDVRGSVKQGFVQILKGPDGVAKIVPISKPRVSTGQAFNSSQARSEIDDWANSIIDGTASIGNLPNKLRTSVNSKVREKLASGDVIKNVALTQKQLIIVNRLAGQFNSSKDYIKTLDVANGFDTIAVLYGTDEKINSSVGLDDITAINAFQKMVDPGVSVREGDVQLLKKSIPVLEKVSPTFQWESLNTGAVMPPKVRRALMRVAKDIYDTKSSRFNNTIVNRFKRNAEAARVPFDLIANDFSSSDEILSSLGEVAAPRIEPEPEPEPEIQTTEEQFDSAFDEVQDILGRDPTDDEVSDFLNIK